MAHQPVTVDVLTPEGLVFSGDAELVSTRTESGAIGILARHEPLLALLAPAELRVTQPSGEVVRFAQGEGYLQVTADRILVLVEEAIEPKKLDTAKLEEQRSEAAARAAAAANGSADYRRAVRDERRATAFLAVAGGTTAAAA